MSKQSTTVLLFAKHGDTIGVGADKRASWGFHKAQNLDTKIFPKKDGTVTAGTGRSSIIQIIGEGFKVPKRSGQSVNEFLLTTLRKRLEEFLATHGVILPSSDHDSAADRDAHTFIQFVHDGKLVEYSISNKAVEADILNFPYTNGCGGAYTMGAFTALEDHITDDQSLVDVMSRALQIAGIHSPGCSEENDVILIKTGKKNDKNNTKKHGRR